MARRPRYGGFSRTPRRSEKTFHGVADCARHACRGTAGLQCRRISADAWVECAKTPKLANAEPKRAKQLDGWAAMLQAISIGKEIPMLEPWIIEEIRHREEERRRGDRPQLELPIPEPHWRDSDADADRGDKAPERGVVIIGM
jgi:hypothetical protein